MTSNDSQVRAVLTNTTRPDERGLAFASFALCDDLGKGAGPALLAHFVHRYGRRAMFAWAMFLASELEEALANEPRCAVAEPAAAGLRGYGSYAAGGGIEQRRGAESTADEPSPRLAETSTM